MFTAVSSDASIPATGSKVKKKKREVEKKR
jgi:hypothetical protein